ncbi:MAG: FHA domain-containing protein [Lachnospiraceae bacterium]|nr:FHA domain-containing protein [Lachnospiraceae bacterium]
MFDKMEKWGKDVGAMEGILVEARNDMRGNYLVAVGCEEGGYREEMLKNSRIPGLLAVTGQDFDGRHELWYETGSMQPLSVRFRQNAPGADEITDLMRQVGSLAEKLEEYLLEPEEIALVLSWIFEGEDGQYFFMYLPGYAKSVKTGVCGLLEELMEYVDYENHRAVSFLYLLHAGSRQQTGGIFALRRLCGEILKAEQDEVQQRREDDFLAEFGEGMKEEEREKERTGEKGRIRKIMGAREALGRKPGGRNGQGINNGGETEENVRMGGYKGREEEISAAGKEEKTGKVKSFFLKLRSYIRKDGETEERGCGESIPAWEVRDLGYDPRAKSGEYKEAEITETTETVLLTGNPETMLLAEEFCSLKPEQEGRSEIRLGGFPFCIGKEETCDYVLKEPVISRRHAKIIHEGTQYFLMDTKSLNGTWLNGKKLAANIKTEVRDGDRIDFADICFIFTCCKS